MPFSASGDLPLPAGPTQIPQIMNASSFTQNVDISFYFVFLGVLLLSGPWNQHQGTMSDFISVLTTVSTILAQSRESTNIWVQWKQMTLCPASEEIRALCPCHSAESLWDVESYLVVLDHWTRWEEIASSKAVILHRSNFASWETFGNDWKHFCLS